MSTLSSVSSALPSATLDQQQYLQLMVTQLQNQDPLDPISDTDFISQLSQFATQAGIEQLNTSFSNMLSLQQLTQGANLVGLNVVYQAPGSSSAVQTGTVTGVTINQGQLQAVIQGQSIPISNIQGIQ